MTLQHLALRQTGHGEAKVEECPIPEAGRPSALVKVRAVSLNPFDWKMLYRQKPSPTPTILGCDFAGTVQCVGEKVENVKAGDRVAGTVYGGQWLPTIR